ncbi:hypothetical protein GCM10009850_087600 [Nonomuraea monospora]|uniref:Uncharacterized protein n=1 Tax=Nonomuraea monospora TaxID=568818 RepID=A0ABN3CV08_9ACTN
MAIATPENATTDNIPADLDAAIHNVNAAAPNATAALPGRRRRARGAPDRPGTAAPGSDPTADGDARVRAVWAA